MFSILFPTVSNLGICEYNTDNETITKKIKRIISTSTASQDPYIHKVWISTAFSLYFALIYFLSGTLFYHLGINT